MQKGERMAEKTDKLPHKFLQEMEQLLGSEEYALYRKSFAQEQRKGLRVNEGKISADDFAALCGQPLESVPWISNGYFYPSSWQAAKDVLYFAGLYYLQEPSAMTPASRLFVKPGDRVLDLCAAPGGKATELGVRLRGEGILIANDISPSRGKALLKNLELFGIPNFCVTCESPENLADNLPEFFDKILVDAPCSGEGMFRKNPDMAKDWMRKGPKEYQPVQREILEQALRMLKPGGYLLYSTCTFSAMENEENILWLFDRHPEIKLVHLPLFPGFADGFGLSGVLRLFPHRIEGEGHFIALLKKEEDTSPDKRLEYKPVRKTVQINEKQKDFGNFSEFQQHLQLDLDPSRIRMIQESLYYLPKDFPEGLRLRYLRTGLLLGQIKKGRFEPSQALAMVLNAEQFSPVFSFSYSDERAVRYLKGETISLNEEEEKTKNSWYLVCLQGGFPLGWAKGTGKTLKNKYYSGWRYQP